MMNKDSEARQFKQLDFDDKDLIIRAGPQSKKWSDQQITLNPTGSIHKKARGKKFDPKKVYFDEGVFI